MAGRVRPADRAAWQRWAEEEFGADQRAVALGTDTALGALIAGYEPVEAQDFAREAVAGRNRGRGAGGLVRGILGGLFHLVAIAFRLAALLLTLGIFAIVAYFVYLYLTGYFPNLPHP